MDIVLFEGVVLVEVPLPEDEDVVLQALFQLEIDVHIIYSSLNKVIYFPLLRLFSLQILNVCIFTLLAEEMCSLR